MVLLLTEFGVIYRIGITFWLPMIYTQNKKLNALKTLDFILSVS